MERSRMHRLCPVLAAVVCLSSPVLAGGPPCTAESGHFHTNADFSLLVNPAGTIAGIKITTGKSIQIISPKTLKAEMRAIDGGTLGSMRVTNPKYPALVLDVPTEVLVAHVCGHSLPPKAPLQELMVDLRTKLTDSLRALCETAPKTLGCSLPRDGGVAEVPNTGTPLVVDAGPPVSLMRSEGEVVATASVEGGTAQVLIRPNEYGAAIKLYNDGDGHVTATVQVTLTCTSRAPMVSRTLIISAPPHGKNDWGNTLSCPGYSRYVAHQASAIMTDPDSVPPCAVGADGGINWPRLVVKADGRGGVAGLKYVGPLGSGFISRDLIDGETRALDDYRRAADGGEPVRQRITNPRRGLVLEFDPAVVAIRLCGPAQESSGLYDSLRGALNQALLEHCLGNEKDALCQPGTSRQSGGSRD